VRRAGSHSGWTPIPAGDRFALGAILLLGLAVMVTAVVGVAGILGWALLTFM
jgi:hypothetical protein